MKKHEMQKPLVQSAVVLVVAIVLISFVAGSEAQGLMGGISSIIKGVFYMVVYALGLAAALAFSVLFLFGIYVAAIAIHSTATAGDAYDKLKKGLVGLFGSKLDPPPRQPAAPAEMKQPSVTTMDEPAVAETVAIKVEEKTAQHDEKISQVQKELSGEIDRINSSLAGIEKKADDLNGSITELKESNSSLPIDDLSQKTAKLEESQSQLSSKVEDCLKTLAEIKAIAEDNAKKSEAQSKEIGENKSKMNSLASDMSDLRIALEAADEESAQEESEHRIFTYIDKDGDKNKFTKVVQEAVEKNMTYAEIDEFLTKSLSKGLDTIIKDHPSLTKDYIRKCKK